MRHFVYFSPSASTSGKALRDGNLMKAGRMDIAIHSFIQALYLSKDFRNDVVFHFVFYGMPDPPKHLAIQITDETAISKKNVARVIQTMLYKYKEGEKREVLPSCFIEKKSLLHVVEDIDATVFLLDKRGVRLRDATIPETCIFVLGDHDGLPKKELKQLKRIAQPISVGPKMYFASQVVAVVNNELDVREIHENA